MTITSPAFPQTIYIPWVHYGRAGWCIAGDHSEDLTCAMDSVIDAMEKDCPTDWHIMRIEFDPDTRLPERTTFADDEGKTAAIKWLTDDNRAVPSWLSGVEPEMSDEDVAAMFADYSCNAREAAE